MHDLAINDSLMDTNAIVLCVRGIGRRGDLNLTPLLVCWHELALFSELLETGEDALVFDIAFALDEWRFCMCNISSLHQVRWVE